MMERAYARYTIACGEVAPWRNYARIELAVKCWR